MSLNTRCFLLISIIIFITVALLDCVSARWIPEDSETTNGNGAARRTDNGIRHHRKNPKGFKQSVDYAATTAQDLLATDLITTKRNFKKRNNNNRRRSGANKNKSQQRIARRAEIIPFMDDPTADEQRKLDHLLGLGVFGDMRKFFNELKTNLDVTEATASPSLEMNSKEENPDAQDDEDLLLPTYLALRTTPPGSDEWMDDQVDETTRSIKSPRLRGFVSMGPASSSFQKTHQYDPALLWTGLGRR